MDSSARHMTDGETEAQSHHLFRVLHWASSNLGVYPACPGALSHLSSCHLLTTLLWLPPVHRDAVPSAGVTA